jgi:hypothetical protein
MNRPQTIKEYADSRNISVQAVPHLKKVKIIEKPLCIEWDGEWVEVKKQKFVQIL